MATLQELRVQRGKVAAALQALVNRDDYDPAVHTAEYDKGMTEIEAIDTRIKHINALNERLAEQTATENLADAAARRGRDKGDGGLSVYAKWLKGGDAALNADDWATIRATMSTTTGSQGGFTVPTEVSSTLTELLRAFGGMREVATVLVTETGAPMSFPTSDGTSELGELVPENTAATNVSMVFGTAPVNVFKYSSTSVTVPIELLMDSAIDVEAYVNQRIVTRLGRITNQHFATGTGTGQPFGVMTAATVGVTAANGTSQVTSVTYASLIDLQHSVDPAYRAQGNCRFMMNDTSLRQVRKILDGSSRPIFVPGYESGNPGGMPDRLLGDPVFINQHVANMTASARSILYGDLRGYIVRDAMEVTLQRFTDSAFARLGQVGFLAWMRCGGNLLDTGAVRVFVNAAS